MECLATRLPTSANAWNCVLPPPSQACEKCHKVSRRRAGASRRSGQPGQKCEGLDPSFDKAGRRRTKVGRKCDEVTRPGDRVSRRSPRSGRRRIRGRQKTSPLPPGRRKDGHRRNKPPGKKFPGPGKTCRPATPGVWPVLVAELPDDGSRGLQPTKTWISRSTPTPLSAMHKVTPTKSRDAPTLSCNPGGASAPYEV